MVRGDVRGKVRLLRLGAVLLASGVLGVVGLAALATLRPDLLSFESSSFVADCLVDGDIPTEDRKVIEGLALGFVRQLLNGNANDAFEAMSDEAQAVTPVERVGITVEDAPFLAVEMAVEGDGESRQIAFRTNVDDLVQVGPDHPLRFDRDAHGGVKPYVKVRGDLWALVTRSLALDLVAMGEEQDVEGVDAFGVRANGVFFPMASLDERDAP